MKLRDARIPLNGDSPPETRRPMQEFCKLHPALPVEPLNAGHDADRVNPSALFGDRAEDRRVRSGFARNYDLASPDAELGRVVAMLISPASVIKFGYGPRSDGDGRALTVFA